MAILDGPGVLPPVEHLRGKLPDRLEKLEPWRLGLDRADQALVGKSAEPIEHITSRLGVRPRDRFGGVQIEAAGEDGQALEQAPVRLVEDVVTPGDRAPKGLLAGREIAGT